MLKSVLIAVLIFWMNEHISQAGAMMVRYMHEGKFFPRWTMCEVRNEMQNLIRNRKSGLREATIGTLHLVSVFVRQSLFPN